MKMAMPDVQGPWPNPPWLCGHIGPATDPGGPGRRFTRLPEPLSSPYVSVDACPFVGMTHGR